jgi:hypothetical protein
MKNEIAMFGCTVADLKDNLDDIVQLSGGVMIAMSIMSDCQEMLELGVDSDKIRQALNRAKWVLMNYVEKDQ